MKVLLTGGHGFVGRHLALSLKAAGHEVLTTASHPRTAGDLCLNLSLPFDLRQSLASVDVVIHTAARVHQMHASRDDPNLYHAINCQASCRLAQQAQEVGVRHFVFLSTIKVLGESTDKGHAFSPNDAYAPADAYATSKANAEKGLMKLVGSNFSVTVVRPPLIYGAGVGANMARLMQWVNHQWPCPFSAVENQRTLLAMENLQQAIELIISTPAARNQILHLGDASPLSTHELFSQLAVAMDKKISYWHLSPHIFNAAVYLPKLKSLSRLTQSLEVNIDQSKSILSWAPSCGQTSMTAMVKNWREQKAHE